MHTFAAWLLKSMMTKEQGAPPYNFDHISGVHCGYFTAPKRSVESESSGVVTTFLTHAQKQKLTTTICTLLDKILFG
jgi:hypothetical protein